MKDTKISPSVQWAVLYVIVALILAIIWPYTFLGSGKTIAFWLIYVFGGVFTAVVVGESKSTLPNLFGKGEDE